MAVKIGINGFGRIGRVMFRAALNKPEIEVAAINDLVPPDFLAHFLKYDSVHGTLDADITASKDSIEVNGKKIAVTAERDPSNLKWGEFGVDIVAESTGLFKKRDDAGKHIAGGAKKVIISAPTPDPDITVVMGVNSDNYDPDKHNIISNASCTTNCLAPIAKVINESFGIKTGFMTTIHAYTGGQKLLDIPHKDLRRGRAAAMSMIPTTTGAAKAVALVLPELEGKLNGMAIRVPTPNVSLVDLSVNIEKSVKGPEEVNAVLKAAAEGSLAGILGYSELQLVSIDYNGEKRSSVVDGLSTFAKDNLIKVLSWYDNETGYSARMIDLAAMIAGRL
jgi:glyceraldehyde 3-phosphate dehydrogenase